MNPDLAGDRLGGAPAVASEHHLAGDANGWKPAHGFADAFADAVAQQDRAGQAIAVRDQHGRGAQTVRF